jgi:PIN domain nuclease of toxin-antitoxin system
VKAIIDTHVFLWWNVGDTRLSSKAISFIEESDNEIYLSAASAWEIAIKVARGRLQLPESPDRYVANRLSLHQFHALPILIGHALHVYHLPDIHHDPFDRLLIAQSQMERIPIITGDPLIHQYPVEVLW